MAAQIFKIQDSNERTDIGNIKIGGMVAKSKRSKVMDGYVCILG